MYITHTEWKSSIQVYCSVLFSVFAELCSCQHSHFRTLISLPKNNSPVCISHHSQTPFLFPWQPPIYFLCLWNCLFWTFCIKESSNIWSFMCDFSSQYVFKLLSYSMYLYFANFYSKQYSMDIVDHILLINSSVFGHLIASTSGYHE